MNDTIAAISTSLGVGAISIIRISGKESIKIVNSIFSSNILNKETHTITYGFIKENEEIIDEVLVSIMKEGKSFTTEDVVEINCHGGIATTRKILELLLKKGCRLAEPGEFTKRAFLNGRIDLTQSEAIMDLINGKTQNARKLAISNLTGRTTNKIKELRSKITKILTNIEVNIDYPEYLDIEEMTVSKIKNEIFNIENSLIEILRNSKNFNYIKNGINVAIIGRPNVGKSSILNRILGESKAIVTDVPGTTRDIVESSIDIDGILLNLIDTAGIRETDDIVEKIGVEKSKKAVQESDLVLLVLNNNEKLSTEDKELLKLVEEKTSIIVVNKSDLEQKIDLENINHKNIVKANTIEDSGIDSIIEKIKEMFNLDLIEGKDFTYVTNIEQIQKIERCIETVANIKKDLDNDMPVDIIEIDLKNIWQTLGEITGEIYSEELLDNLFKDFCVGK